MNTGKSKTKQSRLTRRTLLQSLLASSALLNSACWAGAQQAENPAKKRMRRIVLVELAGGNDGLNTIVPFTQARYYAARPVLAIPRDQLHQLDENLGLHPALEPLMQAWSDRDLHVALGVGYPNPNRSHFRSIDIWNTASGNDKVLEQGWLANAFAERELAAEGIVFGGDFGPLLGSERSLVLDRPDQFVRQARQVKDVTTRTNNPALAHVVAVRHQVSVALQELDRVLEKGEVSSYKTGSALSRQLHIISDLIANEVNVPVLKATLKGFDTHFFQPNRHKNRLDDLAQSLSGLRQRLIASGDWNDTVIMTYSEFGRRPAENGSRGTDHGTAAPVLVMGGAVRGGMSGQQPVLPNNPEQDLDFALDYRSLYRTVAQDWLNVLPRDVNLGGFERLRLFT